MIEILIRVPDGHPATRTAIADLAVAVMTVEGTFRLHHVDDTSQLARAGEIAGSDGNSGETTLTTAVRGVKRAVKGSDQ